jgi:hypothetical protein
MEYLKTGESIRESTIASEFKYLTDSRLYKPSPSPLGWTFSFYNKSRSKSQRRGAGEKRSSAFPTDPEE